MRVEGRAVVDPVREGKAAYGISAASDRHEDLIVAGVTDPAKVVD